MMVSAVANQRNASTPNSIACSALCAGSIDDQANPECVVPCPAIGQGLVHRMRKAGFAGLPRKPSPGIAVNEHFVGDSEIVFEQVCKLSCEGIVSKWLGSLYRSGRSKRWIKV